MGLNYIVSRLSQFTQDSNIRLFLQEDKMKLKCNEISFISCISMIESGSRPKGGIQYIDETEDFAYSIGGEQILEDGSINITNIPKVSYAYYVKTEKGKVKNNDILVCKDGALTGKCCFVKDLDENENVMVNEHVYIIRSNEKIDQKILFYLMRSEYFQRQIKNLAYRKKGQPGLNSEHISKLYLPSLEPIQQVELKNKIIKANDSINAIINFNKSEEEIINKYFAEKLSFDINEFNDLNKEKIYTTKLSSFSNNIDTRFSYKFHSKASVFMNNFLLKKTKKKLKDFIAEPIVLGKSVSPNDFDTHGSYYYLSMANIKDWKVDLSECKKVSKNYSDKNLNKSVSKNDIILARSGEGTIGKVALVENEIDAIFADFTQRIRIKDYKHKLIYYYFRSIFAQYFIYANKKGLGNNTNIFPGQIVEMPIIDWDLKLQENMVRELDDLLGKQKQIKNDISNIRQQLIEEVNKMILS